MANSNKINEEDLDTFLVKKTTTFMAKVKALNSESAVAYAEKHLYEMNISDKTHWTATKIENGK